MSKIKDQVIAGHNYDGIQELDNDLPSWWLKLFYTTIAIAVVYMFYFHFLGLGLTSSESYLKATDPNWTKASRSNTTFSYSSPYSNTAGEITPALLKKLGGFIGEDVPFEILIREAKRRATADQLALLNNDFPDASLIIAPRQTESSASLFANLEALVDDNSLAEGKAIFTQHCAVCHGPNGEGKIGPNFCDDYWIHGGTIEDLVRTITLGVPAKGMISWQSTLPPDKILKVGSYIKTLAGTDPPNQKAPQGEKITVD